MSNKSETKKNLKPLPRPYMNLTGGITGTLVREKILSFTMVENTMKIVEREIAEYFANKEFKEIMDNDSSLKYGTRKVQNIMTKIYKKHGIDILAE